VQGDYTQSDNVRDEVLMGLVSRAITDPEFKRRARRDVEGALWEYRYQLTDEELEVCKEFFQGTKDLTNEELDRRLAQLSSERGI
jgi:hypothetical protein